MCIRDRIGTVLQQNQPYPDYILKFGPFWFAVFNRIGLYDVYGTGWFIAILAFLILSTSVCLYRQAPGMLREMTRFRASVQMDSLRGFHQQAEWRLPDHDSSTVQADITGAFRGFGYCWRMQDHGDHQVVAAMKGRYNRMGYLLTHAAVVTIGIGGLLDGNLWLKLKEWRGELAVETRDLSARETPPISRLAPGAIPAFRGNVRLPEGSAANFVFLRVRDGFLVQELPFAIELKEFQVAYYDTGQPKSYTCLLYTSQCPECGFSGADSPGRPGLARFAGGRQQRRRAFSSRRGHPVSGADWRTGQSGLAGAAVGSPAASGGRFAIGAQLLTANPSHSSNR